MNGETVNAMLQDLADLTNLDRVAPTATASRVLVEIVDSIRYTAMREGDRLPSLDELAVALEVSRENVRRAVTALAEAGVLDVRVGRGGGTWVKDRAGIPTALSRVISRSTSTSEWEDLVAFRQLLQTEAACLVGERRDPAITARIHEYLAELQREAAGGDVARVLSAANELNCAIAVLCGNRVLARSLLRTIDLISVIGVWSMSDLDPAPGFIGRVEDISRRLVHGIAAGDREQINASVAEQMSLTLGVLKGDEGALSGDT
ncbi:FadR/GntR family transcriptional regulator [Streptosporangium carneum]|uniref:FadR/GntR family transcriptional regulator n=1 Tax=Streptosporangium carneum TaxID=47481 RepID=UPI0022F2DCFC|nr:GntR family transcriptional regulator [Streptosporangium carneum]